jgi:glycosyltransferase involved in cell wall biosynthesis
LDKNQICKVAVITPYYKESIDDLIQCHHSVLAQSHPCLHVLVADGHPISEIDNWNAHHVKLPTNHDDIGSTPRLIGSYHAIGLGIDAVLFLDADNWFSSAHVEQMLHAYRAYKSSFVTCSRTLCRIDGSEMGVCPITNPDRFIDTNCMLIGREAFHVLHHWALMPSYGHLIGDRIMLYHLKKAGLTSIHLDSPTVYYRCKKEGLYRQMGEEIPIGATSRPDYEASFKRWEQDGNPPLR